MNFHLLDWIILFLYLGISVFIGLWARRYVENMEGYFVAGRRVKVALGSATLIATEIGVVTFMYFGELGYVTGFSCFVLGIIGAIGYFVIGKTGFVVSGLRRLNIITIPEFYELRYGRRVRLLGGILLFLGGVLNMGVFLRMDGIFLTETLGFGPEVLAIVMTVMLIVVISYTVFGGMFSVVITDFIQFVVLSFGMLIATVFILVHVDFAAIASGRHSPLWMDFSFLDDDRQHRNFRLESTGRIQVVRIREPGGWPKDLFVHRDHARWQIYDTDDVGYRCPRHVRARPQPNDRHAKVTRNRGPVGFPWPHDRRDARSFDVNVQRLSVGLELGRYTRHHRAFERKNTLGQNDYPTEQDHIDFNRSLYSGVWIVLRAPCYSISVHRNYWCNVCRRSIRMRSVRTLLEKSKQSRRLQFSYTWRFRPCGVPCARSGEEFPPGRDALARRCEHLRLPQLCPRRPWDGRGIASDTEIKSPNSTPGCGQGRRYTVSSISIIWIVVFALACLLFFGTAAVITVKGTRDLKDLLRKTETRNQQDA
jgi:hypothetical protein